MPLLNRENVWEDGPERNLQRSESGVRNLGRNPDPYAAEAILRRVVEREAPGKRTISAGENKRGGLMQTCANPQCRTGWMQLWRNRSGPVFEGGWSCSAACTEARLRVAVSRENKGRTAAKEPYRHRIPLGLLMLEKGWITEIQLREAVTSQKQHGGRLGSWLVRQQGVSEELVTRALALQWSCPVLSTGAQDAERLAPLVPRLFVDAFGAVPLRLAAGKVLYLGFEDRLDPVLARAIERMTELRVECGVVADADFGPSHERALRTKYPPVELVEAVSEETLARAMARTIEKVGPAEARLVRVHDFLWLRMLRKAEPGVGIFSGSGTVPGTIEDVIGTVGG
jgi:Type II secretion system (T2SS), protein E, N-terminal domain